LVERPRPSSSSSAKSVIFRTTVTACALDRARRAPAAAVDHLLVGEHGPVDRIPVYLALLAVDEAGLEQVEEQRLLVAVIVRLAGGELAAPVEREAEPLQLRLIGRDVLRRPFPG
jgi:hypothetical protein